jgi:hypothetical protein
MSLDRQRIGAEKRKKTEEEGTINGGETIEES